MGNRTLANRPKNEKTNDYESSGDDVADYIYQEKKEEEDLPALKTVLTHRWNDSRTTYKNMN